jgi:hypothetical protein
MRLKMNLMLRFESLEVSSVTFTFFFELLGSGVEALRGSRAAEFVVAGVIFH